MVLDIIGAGLLALGLLLATVGLYGMLRKSGIFEQLHAAGLITGPAIILVLLASVATRNVRVITSAILLILFLLITSPLSTHAIAQAAHRRALGEASSADEDDGRQTATAARDRQRDPR
jgi:monovalent cation/proton antiporter MnhG/PhaG subunit